MSTPANKSNPDLRKEWFIQFVNVHSSAVGPTCMKKLSVYIIHTYSPGITVSIITTIVKPPFQLRIGELGRCKMENQLNYGTYEPRGDVWITRLGLVPISP